MVIKYVSEIIIFSIIAVLLLIYIFAYTRVDIYKLKLKNFLDKFRYYPKKSGKIYDTQYISGGMQLNNDENTIDSYQRAIDIGMGILVPVRVTQDRVFFCFNDRYTDRILSTPGKFSNKTSNNIRKFKILDSKKRVLMLKEALKFINGRVPIILEIKEIIGKSDKLALYKIIEEYRKYGQVYILCPNLNNYFCIKKFFPKLTFFKYNIFRKEIKILYDKKSSSITRAYDALKFKNIVMALEEDKVFKNITDKFWYIINRYRTRIDENDKLLSIPIAHRAIVDKRYKEHSVESIKQCIEYGCIAEIDVSWYDKSKEARCYHSDKFSSTIIGQPTSCAEKIQIENVPSLKSVLETINRKDAVLILDIKDAHYLDRKLEKAMIHELAEFKGEVYIQSFNPFVVRWFFENYPKYKRGIVCNSLSNMKKVLPQVGRISLNAFLSSYGKPDYIVYDFGNLFDIFSALNNTIGLPVLIYAPKSESELSKYKGYYYNFIGENYCNKKDWENTLKYEDGKIKLKDTN